MPLTSHTTDSLPYIDRPPSPASLAAATTLINSSLPPASSRQQRPLHPSLPPAPTPSFTPLIRTELARLSAAAPAASSSSSPSTSPDGGPEDRRGVDMSRYSALPTLPPPPPPSSSSSLGEDTQQQQQAEAALRQSYINATYLRLRNEQLGLLERYGRNAWLVGNETLEEILREKERGLVETRAVVEEVNRGRKAGQIERGGAGEDGVEGLERRWREGVGRGVEVGIAVREVEGRIREG